MAITGKLFYFAQERADQVLGRVQNNVDKVFQSIRRVITNLSGTQVEISGALTGAIEAQRSTLDPTGFENPDDCVLTFDDATRILTLTPLSSSGYDIWHQGSKTIIDNVRSIQIDDTTGTHFVYFDEDSVLQKTTTFTNDLITKYVFVSNILWNSTTQSKVVVQDEKHGCRMSSRTHEYLHHTIGTKWASGGALENIISDGGGSDNSHATFGVSDVIIWDEDLEHDSRTRNQTLTNPAQIKTSYLTGSGVFTLFDTVNDYPCADAAKVGSGTRLHYNKLENGDWSLAEVGNGKFVLTHILSNPDIDNLIFATTGINEYANTTAAREGALSEILDIFAVSAPGVEVSILATVIFQTSTGYSNDPKAQIVSTGEGDYVDWRTAATPTAGKSVTDHGLLTGLADDDHQNNLYLLGRSGGQYLSDSLGIGVSPSGISTKLIIEDNGMTDVGDPDSIVTVRQDDASVWGLIIQNKAHGELTSGGGLGFWQADGGQSHVYANNGNLQLNAGGGYIFISSSGDTGINTTAPLGKLHVQVSDVARSPASFADVLVLEENGPCGMSIISSNTSYGSIFFADTDDADAGYFQYSHSNERMAFGVEGLAKLYLSSSGGAGIGKLPSYKLDIDLATNDFAIEDATTATTAGSQYGSLIVRVGGVQKRIKIYDVS